MRGELCLKYGHGIARNAHAKLFCGHLATLECHSDRAFVNGDCGFVSLNINVEKDKLRGVLNRNVAFYDKLADNYIGRILYNNALSRNNRSKISVVINARLQYQRLVDSINRPLGSRLCAEYFAKLCGGDIGGL